MKVVVVGCAGRMGAEVCRVLEAEKDIELVAGVESLGHPAIGSPLGSGVVHAELEHIIDSADVVVDFSTPEATMTNVALAAARCKPFVTGVTGFSPAQMLELEACSAKIPVVQSPNFSVGVNALCKLVAEAAALLGPGYDVEIIETHHRQKKDAPSGTAARLVEVLKKSTGRTRVCHGRQGVPGAKSQDEIGISSVRTGSVVGEHTVVFGTVGERIELTHKAESRAAFATGVVSAVRFLTNRAPGFYTIEDVLATAQR
jgi:4-hydroxy-tetrahydrodipicolinate reductase